MADNTWSIQVDRSDNQLVKLYLSGELVVKAAEQLQHQLQEDWGHLSHIVITVDHPVVIDLSFLQLLISFVEQRNRLNKKTEIRLDLEDSMTELLQKTGIVQLLSSQQTQ